MKIYCPFKNIAWGDWVVTLWAAEYIKTFLPDATIHFDDISPGGHKVHTVSDISWVDELVDSTIPQTQQYDFMLCTHHRHHIVEYNEPYEKIYFDAHGISLKFILENWYPTFKATKPLIKSFEKLNLPEEYDVIHYSSCKSNARNKSTYSDFLKKYEWIWKNNKNMVSTGLEPIPECRDLQKIAPMLKIYVMLKARKVYASQTGFTGIPAMYRKRQNVYLLDGRVEAFNHLGPPVAIYTNVSLTGDLKPIYYYLEKNPIKDYYQWSRNNWVTTEMFYPDFKVVKDESPSEYIPKKVYTNIENCPMPFNYNIEYKEIYD